MEKLIFAKIEGKVVVNTTPHDINFDVDGTVVTVPKCGALLNARPTEVSVGDDLVTTKFVPTEEGQALINAIKAQHAASDNAAMPLRIVGSIIAAQAYPEQVVAMTPAPGYERVAPAEKRMNPHKFTIFVK